MTHTHAGKYWQRGSKAFLTRSGWRLAKRVAAFWQEPVDPVDILSFFPQRAADRSGGASQGGSRHHGTQAISWGARGPRVGRVAAGEAVDLW
jgi:hypothetical protein